MTDTKSWDDVKAEINEKRGGETQHIALNDNEIAMLLRHGQYVKSGVAVCLNVDDSIKMGDDMEYGAVWLGDPERLYDEAPLVWSTAAEDYEIIIWYNDG